MRENYSAVREALGRFTTDAEEKNDVKCEAAVLCHKLDKMETAIMAILWDTVLSRFKAASDTLKCDINLDTAQRLLESLHLFVATLRDQFFQFEKSSQDMESLAHFYQHETQRARKRSIFSDESMENQEIQNVSHRFKVKHIM